MNIKDTFLKLTEKTYPYPLCSESAVVLKSLTDKEILDDGYGNWYTVIGDSDTMFTSHLDTADDTQKNVIHSIAIDKNGDEWVGTDNNSLLGADCKAGTVIMLAMMEQNIPGIYYFFKGEEVGMIGSREVASDWENNTLLKGVKKCISFDRMDFGSIITHQMGKRCASEEFSESLSEEFAKFNIDMDSDPTGSYTDSAAFLELIPECTNISVGYFNQHTNSEIQNLTFLSELTEACINVDWSNLVVKRKVTISDELYDKHSGLIGEIKESFFDNSISLIEENDMVCFSLKIDSYKVENLYNDVAKVEEIVNEYYSDTEYYTELEGETIKIYLV